MARLYSLLKLRELCALEREVLQSFAPLHEHGSARFAVLAAVQNPSVSLKICDEAENHTGSRATARLSLSTTRLFSLLAPTKYTYQLFIIFMTQPH